MKTLKSIYEVLDERRRRLGMSCRVVAERSGVSVSTVQRVLNGDETVKLSNLSAISHALGCEVRVASVISEDAFLMQKAKEKARLAVLLTQGTSGLESQGVSKQHLRKSENRIAWGLLAKASKRKIWS